MSVSNNIETKLLDHLLRGTTAAYTPKSDLYLALLRQTTVLVEH